MQLLGHLQAEYTKYITHREVILTMKSHKTMKNKLGNFPEGAHMSMFQVTRQGTTNLEPVTTTTFTPF